MKNKWKRSVAGHVWTVSAEECYDTIHSKESSLKSAKSQVVHIVPNYNAETRDMNDNSVWKLPTDNTISLLWNVYNCFLMYTSPSLRVTSPFSHVIYQEKNQNIADNGISTVYSTYPIAQKQTQKCAMHICHHSTSKREKSSYDAQDFQYTHGN